MPKTKIELHVELNESFNKILDICLLLDLKPSYLALEKGRVFISNAIDKADIADL